MKVHFNFLFQAPSLTILPTARQHHPKEQEGGSEKRHFSLFPLQAALYIVVEAHSVRHPVERNRPKADP